MKDIVKKMVAEVKDEFDDIQMAKNVEDILNDLKKGFDALK